MTTTEATATVRFFENKGRDDYGRSVLTVGIMKDRAHRPTGVVVTMPKAFRDMYPEKKYLVNNWELTGKEAVTYHSNRNAAIAFLKAELLKADKA